MPREWEYKSNREKLFVEDTSDKRLLSKMEKEARGDREEESGGGEEKEQPG